MTACEGSLDWLDYLGDWGVLWVPKAWVGLGAGGLVLVVSIHILLQH